jgi:hypothetical protein
MNEIQLPVFKTYEEEAQFWDDLDTADFMPDDNEWVHFDTAHQRAIRVAILPTIAQKLMERAHAQGVSIETLVNVLLAESIYQLAPANQLN